MSVMHTPDRWVVIWIDGEYRLLATWRGGYLDGEGWRVNSGIVSVEQDDDHYYFFGYSGSIYKCHKKGYGATPYGSGVLRRAEELGGTVLKEDEFLNIKRRKYD